MKASDLGKLLALFNNGEAWTQRNFAKTPNGMPCSSFEPKAVKWCLWGGCYKLGLHFHDVTRALRDAEVVPYGYSIVTWNDSATDFSVIRSGLTKAMIMLKERER